MANVEHQVTEATPLLAPSAADSSPPNKSCDSTASRAWSAWQRHFAKWATMYACGLFVLLVDVPNFMSEVPKLRMLELGLCRDYYSISDPGAIDHDGNVPESLCKIPEIQASLARMRGMLDMIEGIPGLILAIPYGVLADMRGRRFVAALSLAGFVLRDLWAFSVMYFYKVFPIRAIYAAPAFLVLGGGSTVISPMIMAIIAATIHENERTQAFLWIQVVMLVTEFIAPPLGSGLMELAGPHFAFLAAVPLEALAFVALGLIREAKPSKAGQDDAEEARYPTDDRDGAAEDPNPTSLKGKIVWASSQLSHKVRHGVGALGSQISLIAGLLALIVAAMGRPMLGLILQYMSVRFGWPLAKTAFLLSIQAAAQMPLFALVLPQAGKWLLKRKKHASAANLALARGSLLFLTAGALWMGFAPSAPVFIAAFVVYTFGNGYSAALRSLLTSLVPKDHLSLLFTAMTVFGGVATIGASPLLGLSFSAGLNIGGMAVSLPFFIAAAFYGMAAVLLFTCMSAGSQVVDQE